MPFKSVLSLLSYLCKAPLVPHGAPVVNSLFRQRAAIENILKACVGLPPNTHMSLEHRFDVPLEAGPPQKKLKGMCKGDITNGDMLMHKKKEYTNGNGHAKEYTNGLIK